MARKVQHPEKAELLRLYNENVMTQKEIAVAYGTTQKVVWRWFRDLEIKSRTPCKRDQYGEKNSSWKGSEATYFALHKRVEVERGKPHYCSVCGTMDAARYEWANLTGRYDDVNDYARMCVKCHRKYDNISMRRNVRVPNKQKQWDKNRDL